GGAADPKVAGPPGGGVEGGVAEVHARPAHPLQGRQAVALGDDKLPAVRAEVGQADVLLPHAEDGLDDLLRRHQIGFLAQVDRVGPDGRDDEGEKQEDGQNVYRVPPESAKDRVHERTSRGNEGGRKCFRAASSLPSVCKSRIAVTALWGRTCGSVPMS